MRIRRAGVSAAVVLLSWVAGCSEDGPGNSSDDTGPERPERKDAGVPECPPMTPEFLIGPDSGISATGARGLYAARLIEAKPADLVVKAQTDWTVQLTDADGEPADVEIAAACAYMPVHSHGIPPFGGVEKLDEPGQYKLNGLYFKMPGPWEVQLAIDPASDQEKVVNYTSCDAMTKRHPAKDYAVLRVCLADK